MTDVMGQTVSSRTSAQASILVRSESGADPNGSYDGTTI